MLEEAPVIIGTAAITVTTIMMTIPPYYYYPFHSLPLPSTKKRVVLSSRSSTHRASTSSPAASPAHSLAMAALAPLSSAAASCAARLVELTSTASACARKAREKAAVCPNACGCE